MDTNHTATNTLAEDVQKLRKLAASTAKLANGQRLSRVLDALAVRSERLEFMRREVEAAKELLAEARQDAARDVLAERARQINAEGYSHAHDDEHGAGELGLAAALYALPYEAQLLDDSELVLLHGALELACNWTLKPEPDRRKRLVKAGALILAEIERLDRAAAQEGGAA